MFPGQFLYLFMLSNEIGNHCDKISKSFDGIWIGLALNCKIRWGKIDMLTVQSLSVQELVYHLSLFTWALFYAHASFPVIFFIQVLHI